MFIFGPKLKHVAAKIRAETRSSAEKKIVSR
jgi:hypothetical protein